MASIVSKIFSRGNHEVELRAYRKLLAKVNDLEASMKGKADEELKELSSSLKDRAAHGESLDSLLPEAFALVREASVRTIGLRHYDVQLMGAMTLHGGHVAEMATGEGKTLVATAAAYLNAIGGGSVHVVTVNDYLAKRDAQWMGPVYEFLGLTVGLLQADKEGPERKKAYEADVVYGTNSGFGFDYLRDNMADSPAKRVQRGFDFAIVDEADSVLIDEARTPLIISGLGGRSAELYRKFAEVVPQLDAETDVVIDEGRKLVYTTEAGLDKVEELLGEEVYADASGLMANQLRQALRARFLFTRDVDYVVKDDEVMIVDEFTGRTMKGRRYSEGLHQAIEAKEGVEVRHESLTMASVTLQNYFRLYDKVGGMTGTALTEDKEFQEIYGMKVVPIPTNKPVVRVDQPDYVFRTKEAKFNAVADEVERRHKLDQPVLVGTTTVKNSERLSALLEERGIPHEMLNAKNHEEEARIVALAGRQGAVTISTNMAGRGTDIHLGGNIDAMAATFLRNYGCTKWERAQDWQKHAALQEARKVSKDESYVAKLRGGLYVIGTERHDARRIDNQLRGRSGRQGDVGESRFFLSLEDDLLMKFGGDRLKAVSDMMAKQGLGDEKPIEDATVSKVIDSAQKEVESLHFQMRKYVLEYDDVLNRQRLAVYKERDAVLAGKDMYEMLPRAIADVVGSAVAAFCPADEPSEDWDWTGLCAWADQMTKGGGDLVREIAHDDDPNVLADDIAKKFLGLIEERREVFGDAAMSAIQAKSYLMILDQRWVQHLQDMDSLRQGIMLRAVGRRDPLMEYKDESYLAFGELVATVYEDWLAVLLRMDPAAGKKPVAEAPEQKLVMTRGDGSGPSADYSRAVDNPLG